MSITVLGIDPSLSNTGLCWGRGPDEHETERISYRIPKGVSIREMKNRIVRIGVLRLQFDDFLKDNILQAGSLEPVVMIEAYSFGSRNGGEYLGEWGGVLRGAILGNTSRAVEVAPTMVKKFATGKGNAKKEVIIGHVQKRWNVLFENSDEADAYVLYRIGLCYAGICEPENVAQREVIEKLKS